jgi:thymidine kinase
MAKLFWRYGAMASGKSAALLMVHTNYECIGRMAVIATAAVDNRYGEAKVTSRMGVSKDAKVYTRQTVFEPTFVGAGVEALLVDEAQFLTTEQVEQLHRLAAVDNIAILCFGLRTDFQGKAFEGSAALGVLADSMEPLRTLCTCGKGATMNIRMASDGQRVREGEQVQIGGNESYRASCARCFYTE